MKKVLIWAVAAMMLAGCDSNNDNVDGEIIPINLSSRLTAEISRSRQENQIADGQQVSFFVTIADNVNDVVYSNARLTADGNGGFSYDYEGAGILYYPVYNDMVDFYAIHPYNSTIALESNYNFTVLANQAAIRNFLNSDLLYVRREDIRRSLNPVQLTFDHKLSKINFIVTAGALTSIAGLNEIEIMNVLSTTSINTTTGVMGTATGSRGNIITYGIADGTASITDSQASGISAIIVPQTIPANTTLFHLTVDNLEFYYTPRTDIVFEEGRSYNFILTLTSSGIEVTSTINDWDAAQDTEGEGIID